MSATLGHENDHIPVLRFAHTGEPKTRYKTSTSAKAQVLFCFFGDHYSESPQIVVGERVRGDLAVAVAVTDTYRHPVMTVEFIPNFTAPDAKLWWSIPAELSVLPKTVTF